MKKALVLCMLGLASCGDNIRRPVQAGPHRAGTTIRDPGPGDNPKPPDPITSGMACSDLFNEDVITDYQVHIDPAEWALIHDEFVNWQVRAAAGLDVNPYHPIEVQVGADVVPAWIRLKGNSTWFVAVAKNPNVKKQFVIAFDQGADSQARFHGVQKVELDQPTLDRSYLHERLAQSFLHDVGLPGLCANSARLIVNGAYYGLYANLEFVNKDYLARVFPGEDGGDLWKKSHERQTNENDPAHDDKRHRALLKATTIGGAHGPDGHGGQPANMGGGVAAATTGRLLGRRQQLLRLRPPAPWVHLPDRRSRRDVRLHARGHAPALLLAESRPAVARAGAQLRDRHGGRHVARRASCEIIAQLLAGWDVTALQERVDRWSAQIAPALEADPNKVATFAVHQAQQKKLRDFVAARPEAVRRWMACYQGGGVDADGDGYAWCMDCDDTSPALHPGAAEICDDGVDQNCNGWLDGCN